MLSKKGERKRIRSRKIPIVHPLDRYAMQNDEIARLQLENGVLQEKFTNERRKVSVLEVDIFIWYFPLES